MGFFDNQLQYINSNVYPDLAPPDAVQCLGARFTPSGVTLLVPLGDSIDFVDGTTGVLRGRLLTPEPLKALNFPITSSGILAMDPSGQSVFAISASGLTVLKLPLPADQLVPALWRYSTRPKRYEGLTTEIRVRQSSDASHQRD